MRKLPVLLAAIMPLFLLALPANAQVGNPGAVPQPPTDGQAELVVANIDAACVVGGDFCQREVCQSLNPATLNAMTPVGRQAVGARLGLVAGSFPDIATSINGCVARTNIAELEAAYAGPATAAIPGGAPGAAAVDPFVAQYASLLEDAASGVVLEINAACVTGDPGCQQKVCEILMRPELGAISDRGQRAVGARLRMVSEAFPNIALSISACVAGSGLAALESGYNGPPTGGITPPDDTGGDDASAA